MRTIEVKLYKYKELSQKAKQRTLEKLYDINVSHEWWDSTYEDAKTIGLEISSFELDRNKHCTGKLAYSGSETAELILENHGEECQTTVLAIHFRAKWFDLVEKYSNGVEKDTVLEAYEQEFDQEADELEKDFETDLLNEYSNMLQKESEYLMSKDAIEETIIVNDYEFTAEGGNIY